MKFKIQSDKNIKIFTIINVFTNIVYDQDISLSLNSLKIKNNQNYIFKTTFLTNNKKSITEEIFHRCSEKNYLNIIILKGHVKKKYNLIYKNLIYFNYVFGKKIIILSDIKPILNKGIDIKEFIFYNKTKQFEIKNLSMSIKKLILEI